MATGLVAGEAPSGLQIAGIAAAVGGVVLASGPELHGSGRGGATPLVLALVAALGFGTVFVLLAEGSAGTGAGVGDVGANGTFAAASQSDLVSVTAVLASSYPAVTALLAFRVHGERLAALQVVGVAAALVGAVLLAAG